MFDHQSVAQQLSKTITATTQSMAIGLLGPFGSGKSSVVRLLTRELAVNKRWAVLHVSAEHHSGVARARALMYALLEAAQRQGLINEDVYRGERASLAGARQHTLPRPGPDAERAGKADRWRYARAAGIGLGWVAAMLLALWLIGVAGVLAGHAAGVGGGVHALTWFASGRAAGVSGVLVSAAAVAAVLAAGKEGALQTLRAYEITVTSPRPDTTDELEQAFGRMLRCIDRRLVIAVDDIDRLAAADVLEALTTIRSFLLTGHQMPLPPVFLLSCDESIVREAIVGVRPGLAHRPAGLARHAPDGGTDSGTTSRDKAAPKTTATETRKATEEAAQEYLNKLFTVRLYLPEAGEADLRDYAAELLLRAERPHPVVAALGGEAEVRTVLETLIHHEVRDPRHVIRLLNSFLTDFQLAQKREQPVGNRPPRIATGEVSGYPIALARLTVLRHDFRQLYDAVAAEHALLHVLDDTLLDLRQDLDDPLLTPYATPTDPPRLDLDRPGLRYLLATVARAKTQRPVSIGPLLSLGSSPASRLLGSAMATDIQQELIGRDTASFSLRLAQTDTPARVLDAGRATIDAARHGQDLDNALTAAVGALGNNIGHLADLSSFEENLRAVRAFTDSIARHYPQMMLPPPTYALVPLLDLTDDAHLPRYLGLLGTPPEDSDEARQWAATLLQMPDGPHRAQLIPAVEKHFALLTETGTEDDLAFWTGDDQLRHQTRWPTSAFAATLTMAARSEDGQALHLAGAAVSDHPAIHQWARPVLRSLLACMNSAAPAPAEAVRILTDAPAPQDDWGPADNSGTYNTLAGQLVAAIADACSDDSSAATVVNALDLLSAWLPDIGKLAEADLVWDAITEVATAVAADGPEAARAVGRIAQQLPEPHAADCLSALAPLLADHRDPDSATGAALRDVLITYLRPIPDSPDPQTRNAIAACTTALTSDLTTMGPAGRFTRLTLPILLTTRAGQELAPALAASLIGALPPTQPDVLEELLPSLHVAFQVDKARVEQLPPAVQRLHQVVSSGYPVPALVFLARYITEPAVDGNWLTWCAQQWSGLEEPTRTEAYASAERSDLPADLRNCLIHHLLTSGVDEQWKFAHALWPTADAEQQISILAAARGRAPDLADCVAEADGELLYAAMARAGENLGSLLDLTGLATHFDTAIALYLEDRLTQPTWTIPLPDAAVGASTDPGSIWEIAAAQMTEDHTTARRCVELIDSLITHHPDSLPDNVVEILTPLLLEADEPLATAIGHALRAHPSIVSRLLRAMKGRSRSTQQRLRNAAFKKAANLD